MAMAPPPPAALPGLAPGPGPAPMPGETDGAPEAETLVTITDDGSGGYMVYAGEPPEPDEPPDPNEPPPADGKPAASVGEALKAVMDILQTKESSAGAPGSAGDQFAAGFSGVAAQNGAAG